MHIFYPKQNRSDCNVFFNELTELFNDVIKILVDFSLQLSNPHLHLHVFFQARRKLCVSLLNHCFLCRWQVFSCASFRENRGIGVNPWRVFVKRDALLSVSGRQTRDSYRVLRRLQWRDWLSVRERQKRLEIVLHVLQVTGYLEITARPPGGSTCRVRGAWRHASGATDGRQVEVVLGEVFSGFDEVISRFLSRCNGSAPRSRR